MNYLFLDRNCALRLQRKLLVRLCGNVFITFERNYETFNKIHAKSSFGSHVGGQEYTNHTTLLKHQSAIKISPLHAFSLKFLVYDNFYALRQILASARFQHDMKHWSRDLLMQVVPALSL